MRWSLQISKANQSAAKVLPEYLFWGEDAALEMASALRSLPLDRGARVTMIFDERTGQVGAEVCRRALQSEELEVHEVVLPDREGRSPRCDDVTHEWLQSHVPGSDLLLAVGSGVVNDSTKWLAASRDVPYAVYATAASMNGYSSANVAATVRGVKTLVHGLAPRVIAADPKIVASAPPKLAAAGLGDMLAKPFSSTDWFVNHVLFDEPFEPELLAIVEPFEKVYLARPEGIASGDLEVIEALFKGLVASGCAMTVHGSSLPASGGEHLISHTIDMLADRDGVEHDLHGRQVGVAAITVAGFYEQLLEMDADGFSDRHVELDSEFWGALTSVVQEPFQKKAVMVADAVGRLRQAGTWDRCRQTAKELVRPADWVRSTLKKAGGATEPSELLSVTPKRWEAVVRNAAAMRSRFTSLDMAISSGFLIAGTPQLP